MQFSSQLLDGELVREKSEVRSSLLQGNCDVN